MSESSNGALTTADALKIAQSILQSRSALAAHLGKSHNGARDYYETLGYILDPNPLDYYARYNRQDIASRIVNAYPDETWRMAPNVWEKNDEVQTPFEVAWERLSEQRHIYHYLHRLDRLSGLGRYGLLLLGVADGAPLNEPIRRGTTLALRYLSLFSEEHAVIDELESDSASPRFGLPSLYRIDLTRTTTVVGDTRTTAQTQGGDEQLVHHERIIHVAEGLLEDDVYGTPRLRPVLNLLDDLQKLIGGSAEAFWRNASRDIIAALRDGAQLSSSDLEEVSEQLDEFIHGFRRILKVQGMDIDSLAPEIASPRDSVDVVMDMISGTTGIPKRILLGSERGELASSQDEGNWLRQVMSRQAQFVTPVMIRELIDRLMGIGILPVPQNGYTVEWLPLFSEDPGQKAERIDKMASALTKIAGLGQVLTVFPLEEIRETVLEWNAVSPFKTDEETAFDEESDDDDFEKEDNEG